MTWIHHCARRQFICVSSSLVFLISGCSLINPHVTPEMDRPTFSAQPSKTAGKAPELPPIEFAGGVGTAIDYANSWRQAYYDAVGDQSKLKNGIALVAVPAAATALYFGISGDAGRDVITGLATGVAGMLGLGSFLESSDRQKVYLAGSQALGCVILASAPLLVPKDQFEQFREDVDGTLPGSELAALKGNQAGLAAAEKIAQDNSLTGKLADTQVKLADVVAAVAALRKVKSDHPALQDAETQMTAARQLIADSSGTVGVAAAYIARILGAEPEIIARVDDVVAKVSVEIVKTEPNIAAITQITGGLSNAAGRIVNIPAPKAVGASATPPVSNKSQSAGNPTLEELLDQLTGNLSAALDRLRISSAALVASTARVRGFLTAQDERARVVGKIEACGLDNLAIGVTINPAVTEVTLKPGQDYNVIISGGKRPYAAVLAGGHIPEGVTLSRGGFDQQPVVATVSTDKDKTKAGNFALAISDATDAGGVLINFTVEDSAAPKKTDATGPGNTSNATGPTALSDYEAKMLVGDGADPRVLRIAMYGAGIRGAALKADVNTAVVRAQIKSFQTDAQSGLTTDGKFDEKTYKAAIAKTVNQNQAYWDALVADSGIKCNIEKSRNMYECTVLKMNDFKSVQDKLGITRSETFDDNMRTAIATSNKAPKNPVDPGQLSLELVSAFLTP